MSALLRVFALRGADREAALDWLHVHCELEGVLEQDEAILVWLRDALPRPPFAGLQVEELPHDPTAAAVTGLEHDAAILVANDLLVRPPWVERPAGFTGIELVVPRGNAFGSGEHASTQAALCCLHAVWDAPASCADVGTGSGILALYAVQRGCPAVQACDIEAEAVAAAQELLPTAVVRRGGPEVLAPADLVVANLTAAEQHAALPGLLALWTRRSALVLSGLRSHEVAPLLARLPSPPDRTFERAPFTAVAWLGQR